MLNKKLFTQAFLFILFPVVTITAIYTYIAYRNRIQILNATIDTKQLEAQQDVQKLFAIMDKSCDVAEDYYNHELKATSNLLLNGGVALEERLITNNVNKVLHSIGIDTTVYEFYLIDQSLKVIKSNNPKEIGYEIGPGNETIKQQFRHIMTTKGFVVDRAAYSDIDSTTRKYCYQGATSKRYILELSLVPKREIDISRQFFNYFDAQHSSYYLKSMELFYATNKYLSPNIKHTIPQNHKEKLASIKNKVNNKIQITEELNGIVTTYNYVYIPMQRGVFVDGWILKLTATNEERLAIMKASLISFLINISLFSIILVSLLLFGVRKITTPLNSIITTINKIKNGAVNERINITNKNEIGVLAHEFNNALNEIEQHKLQLETKVTDRTLALKATNEQLSIETNRKELLIKETHHRVKNSLQMISSLIRLQASNIGGSKSELTFDDIQSRIMTLSSVHDSLYKGTTEVTVNANDFIPKLVGDIFYSVNNNKQITYTLTIDDFKLDAKHISTLGLLINECITNSFKYAFNHTKVGSITLELTLQSNGKIYFKYFDNGVGYTSNAIKTDSLGLFLINSFAEQLGGQIQKLETSGTCYEAHLDVLKT
jgi:two-component sensor histidine kinase/HAMP domain-containing protein